MDMATYLERVIEDLQLAHTHFVMDSFQEPYYTQNEDVINHVFEYLEKHFQEAIDVPRGRQGTSYRQRRDSGEE